ncbi:hypothetical protein ACLMJK_005480 [Lecanora helva]
MLDRKGAKVHKLFGQKGQSWEFKVANHLKRFDAPAVGIMSNKFKNGEDIESYRDRVKDNVQPDPMAEAISVGTYTGRIDRYL